MSLLPSTLISSNSSKTFYKHIHLKISSFPSSNLHHLTKHPNHKTPIKSESTSNKQNPKKPNNSQPGIIPKKPKRGRKSEAMAVEDFVRNSLEKTLTSIKEKNPELFDNKDEIFRKDGGEKMRENEEMVVDEDDPNWPIDSEVGWGTRASKYFEEYPIKNVVCDDGFEVDWEGEVDDFWVQEINCLEWETFAFHPSPLIVLVFERYNRASDNWKLLKEMEKALKVYWNAKDRLPPRAVKLDINIEKDLAYALKVRECPQILFLRGQRILYREKELRSADELIHMIAYFYYKAKKPSCIDDTALSLF